MAEDQDPDLDYLLRWYRASILAESSSVEVLKSIVSDEEYERILLFEPEANNLYRMLTKAAEEFHLNDEQINLIGRLVWLVYGRSLSELRTRFREALEKGEVSHAP